MVKADLISSGKFDEITRLTKEAVATMLGFDFAHIPAHKHYSGLTELEWE